MSLPACSRKFAARMLWGKLRATSEKRAAENFSGVDSLREAKALTAQRAWACILLLNPRTLLFLAIIAGCGHRF